VQYGQEMILNITLFAVKVWGGQYREVLILNICVCFEGLWREI
jgi:hypothetical protein